MGKLVGRWISLRHQSEVAPEDEKDGVWIKDSKGKVAPTTKWINRKT